MNDARNPFSIEEAQRQQALGAAQAQAQSQQALQHYQHPTIQQQREINGRQPVADSTDALFGALLRDVLELSREIAGLRELVAELRADMRKQPSVVMFPSNALRHSR